MDFNEFHKQLADAPLSFRRKLRDYLRHPTERNACYITWYIAALEDARLFKTDGAASYWLALIGRTRDEGALGCDLIAEMDNTPADGAQAAEIEALQAEVGRLKRILGRIVKGDGDSTATIRTGTDAFAAAREYLLRDHGGGLSND